MDGVSFCGPRTYTISNNPGTLSISGDLLTLISTDPNDAIGTVTVTITASLDNYIGITDSATIDV